MADVIYRATIAGTFPLLQHRYPKLDVEGLLPYRAPDNNKPTPEEEAEAGLYRMSDGKIGQPAEHIHQCMIKSAVQFSIKGQGKKTYKDIVNGCLFIEPTVIPHETQVYEVYTVPVVVQRARVPRGRALIRDWRLSFDIRVIDPSLIAPETIHAILEYGGRMIGIGDRRPRFGRFAVSEFGVGG